MRILYFFAFTLFISNSSAFAQNDEDSEDHKAFISVLTGINLNQMQSSGEIFKQSRFGTGYKVGVQLNYFPDYQYQQLYLRLAASYSKETSESKNTVMFQQQAVTANADIDFANIEIFFAYRFATETKVDGYLGGGLQFQQKLNGDDNAYTFVPENGAAFPIFDSEDFDLPLRYQTDGPKASLGPFAELGAFVPVGNKLLGIATGISYGFFFTNSSADLKFEKANLYINASYELF